MSFFFFFPFWLHGGPPTDIHGRGLQELQDYSGDESSTCLHHSGEAAIRNSSLKMPNTLMGLVLQYLCDQWLSFRIFPLARLKTSLCPLKIFWSSKLISNWSPKPISNWRSTFSNFAVGATRDKSLLNKNILEPQANFKLGPKLISNWGPTCKQKRSQESTGKKLDLKKKRKKTSRVWTQIFSLGSKPSHQKGKWTHMLKMFGIVIYWFFQPLLCLRASSGETRTLNFSVRNQLS